MRDHPGTTLGACTLANNLNRGPVQMAVQPEASRITLLGKDEVDGCLRQERHSPRGAVSVPDLHSGSHRSGISGERGSRGVPGYVSGPSRKVPGPRVLSIHRPDQTDTPRDAADRLGSGSEG